MTDILSPQTTLPHSDEGGPTPKERMLALIGYAPLGIFIVRAMGEVITNFVDAHLRQGIILWGTLIILGVLLPAFIGCLLVLVVLGIPAHSAFHGKSFLYPGIRELSQKLPF